MAKKYYWLKLKEDWFEDDTISWIEEQENGKDYCLFYLKLCLKSLKSDGILIRTVGDMLVPYDAKKLAEMTKTDFDTVVVALELFKKIGLIQILENGELYLTQLNEMVGSETDKAVLMRKKRAKGKKIGNNVTEALPNCYTEKEKEKEKDIELEKEVEVKRIDYTSIVNMYNETCVSFPRVQALSDARKKAIKSRLNTYTIDDFKTLFEKAEASDFLKGKNNRDWQANFDWLIKDANMAKVLDGNYDNKTPSNPTGNNFNQTQGFYRNDSKEALEASYRMYAEWAEGEE